MLFPIIFNDNAHLCDKSYTNHSPMYNANIHLCLYLMASKATRNIGCYFGCGCPVKSLHCCSTVWIFCSASLWLPGDKSLSLCCLACCCEHTFTCWLLPSWADRLLSTACSVALNLLSCKWVWTSLLLTQPLSCPVPPAISVDLPETL